MMFQIRKQQQSTPPVRTRLKNFNMRLDFQVIKSNGLGGIHLKVKISLNDQFQIVLGATYNMYSLHMTPQHLFESFDDHKALSERMKMLKIMIKSYLND